MISTVLAAVLAVGAYDPVGDVPLHKVPGPAFQIPCKVQAADLVVVVQLWVSADRGKKWELHEEITPDKPAFTFIAKRSGEYWFVPRIKKKDGTLLPAETGDLVATQRVSVASGSDSPEPLATPTVSPAAAIAELDEELTRVELELIRKEIKKLSEAKELTPETEEKFNRLRGRLRDLRDHIRPDRGSAVAVPPTLFPDPIPSAPGLPPSRIISPVRPPDDGLIPPSALPTDPLVTPAPARPVAPMPRVRER